MVHCTDLEVILLVEDFTHFDFLKNLAWLLFDTSGLGVENLPEPKDTFSARMDLAQKLVYYANCESKQSRRGIQFTAQTPVRSESNIIFKTHFITSIFKSRKLQLTLKVL